jgi:hypothetical protein
MTIRYLENRIFDFEGIRVRIRHTSGRDVRSDKNIGGRYQFMRRASDSMSITEWLRNRFVRSFPGFHCDVLDSNSHRAHGRTLLGRIRKGSLN